MIRSRFSEFRPLPRNRFAFCAKIQDVRQRYPRMAISIFAIGFLLLFCTSGTFVCECAAQPTVHSILGDPKPEDSLIPEARESYQGREIAQTMHYLGAEWLVRDTREREERCSIMLTKLGVKPGMTVCDMGCGNGFYSLPLAKMVGEDGQVLAVDVQPEMLSMLRERSELYGLTNISPILGSFHDPHLPPNSVDVVLLVDVYHEFSYPEQMLRAIRRALKPDGVAVLLEYRTEDPDVPIKRLHKMSKEQIMKEWPVNGYKLVEEFDGLPWQHMMFFGRDESWMPEDSDD